MEPSQDRLSSFRETNHDEDRHKPAKIKKIENPTHFTLSSANSSITQLSAKRNILTRKKENPDFKLIERNEKSATNLLCSNGRNLNNSNKIGFPKRKIRKQTILNNHFIKISFKVHLRVKQLGVKFLLLISELA